MTNNDDEEQRLTRAVQRGIEAEKQASFRRGCGCVTVIFLLMVVVVVLLII